VLFPKFAVVLNECSEGPQIMKKFFSNCEFLDASSKYEGRKIKRKTFSRKVFIYKRLIALSQITALTIKSPKNSKLLPLCFYIRTVLRVSFRIVAKNRKIQAGYKLKNKLASVFPLPVVVPPHD